MGIDDMEFLEFLVDYALIKKDESICRKVDAKISSRCSEIGDIDFNKSLVAKIRESSDTDFSWWKEALGEGFIEDTTPVATHTDFEKLKDDILSFVESAFDKNLIFIRADDQRYQFFGYVVYYQAVGRVPRCFSAWVNADKNKINLNILLWRRKSSLQEIYF